MNKQRQSGDNGRGKQKEWEKILTQWQLVFYKCDMDWPMIELGPPRWTVFLTLRYC